MRGEKHDACQVLFDHIKQGQYTFSQICVKGNKTVSAGKNTGFLGDANKVLIKLSGAITAMLTGNTAYFVWEHADTVAESSLPQSGCRW